MEKIFYLGDYVTTLSEGALTGRVFEKTKEEIVILRLLLLNGGSTYVAQSNCELVSPVNLNNPDEEFYFGIHL